VAPAVLRGLFLRVAQATTTLPAQARVSQHPGQRVAPRRWQPRRAPGPDLLHKDRVPGQRCGSPVPAGATMAARSRRSLARASGPAAGRR